MPVHNLNDTIALKTPVRFASLRRNAVTAELFLKGFQIFSAAEYALHALGSLK
jgi:hypothetical protein